MTAIVSAHMDSERELDEFRSILKQVQDDSKEIEEELEAELLARAKLCEDLQTRLSEYEKESDLWKQKFQDSQKSVQTLETQVEDLLQESRIKEASIVRLEEENHRLLELLALNEVDKPHK